MTQITPMQIGRAWCKLISLVKNTIKNSLRKKVAFFTANLVSHLSISCFYLSSSEILIFLYLFLGIVSKVERHEWAQKRRDIAHAPAEIDHLNNNRRGSYETSRNNIIGGIDVENESERWKTNYHRLAGQESTGRDQLTLQKRQLPKKILSGNNSVPNSARGPGSARGVYEQPSSIYSTSTTKETYGPIEGSLVGYKAPREVNRSLLSNISSQINID